MTYRTKPAALIVKPYAVDHLNRLLGQYEAGVIDQATLSHSVQDEIQRGSILTPCWESVEATLTGRREGLCVEFHMSGIEGTWWSIESELTTSARSGSTASTRRQQARPMHGGHRNSAN